MASVYDDKGREISKGFAVSGTPTYAISRSDDAVGRTQTITHPEMAAGSGTSKRLTVGYAFHQRTGRTSEVTQDNASGPGKLLWKAEFRDEQGRVTAEQYGNGWRGTRTFDPLRDVLTYIKTIMILTATNMIQQRHRAC